MPTEPRKETSKSAVAARARMLVASNLGWLEGFPLAVAAGCVRWMTVPAHGPALEVNVERRHLSRGTYTLNKLRGEHSPALPRLADEPEVWMASVERRLELLKPPVHHGDPLPKRLFEEPFFPKAYRERAARLATDEPRMQPILNAVSWVYAGHPERARTALDTLAQWSPGFQTISARLGELPALVLLLRLLQLAVSHGRERVQALATCLFDERTHDVNLEEGSDFCTQILSGLGRRAKSPLPEALPPGGSLGRELALWCEELVQQSHRAQQQTLRLFELAMPLPLIERWALWWPTTRQLLREAQKERTLPYQKESRKRLRQKVAQHRESAPPALPSYNLIGALRQHMTASASVDAGTLSRVLALVPAEATEPGRLQLFIYWSFLNVGGPASRMATLLAGFERYLRRAPGPGTQWLRPWQKVSQVTYYTVEDELGDRGLSRRLILDAYDHLASVATKRGELDQDTAAKAVDLFLLVGESDLAARILESLLAGNALYVYVPPALAKLALRFCRNVPERFAEVMQALVAQEENWGHLLPPNEWPEALLEPLSSGELSALMREAIVTRQLARLLACGTKSALLHASGIQPLPLPVLGEPVEPEWMERYPPQLHVTIRRLAAVLDDAEARMARWLGDDLPDSQRLEREIRAIEPRLAELDEALDERRRAALATRLRNLRERLERPTVPSPARMERLLEKLDRAWGRAVLDRWESEIDARLPGALQELLGAGEKPPWLTDPGPLSLLAAASRLPRAHRQLAYRLFRVRCGPPPWDLRDAPQNRHFVESLPNLDWHPWIDGDGATSVETATGQRLRLALEDDPLEIFRMGAHFQTCLSPDGVNFFSVFANAADINKRVLYARDDDGRVVGRCLLALTATGELLTFAAYCHDASLGFEGICAGFADQLAQRMRTRRVARGKVPTLVALDWYDDGPRDLGGRYPALEEGSPLRRRLPAVRPGELLDELRRGLKPARLNEATLPMVLELPEIQQRPELAVPMLRLVAESQAIPDESLVTAARLALEAGAVDQVRRLLLRPLTEHLRRVMRHPWIDSQAPELFLRLDPARLLGVLRQTREKTVHDWLDETYGRRLECAAAAFDALYRSRQARLLWQRLAFSDEVGSTSGQRERARAALGESDQTP